MTDLLKEIKINEESRDLGNSSLGIENMPRTSPGENADNLTGLNALEIVRAAAAYLGLPLIETLQDPTSNLAAMMLSLLNRACGKATLEYNWSQLKFPADFAPNPAVSLWWNGYVKGYFLEVIAHGFVSFESTFLRAANGTKYSFCSLDEYRKLENNTDASINKFTIRNKCICFADPQPPISLYFSFDYRSNWAVFSSVVRHFQVTDAEYKRYFVYDDDLTLLDEELLIKGIILNYKKLRGENAQAEQEDYTDTLKLLIDNNSSAAIKSEHPSTLAYRFRKTSVDMDDRQK
jgi:hypothetical protein